MAALRYVVLHHTGVEVPHFDLMFQRPAQTSLSCVRCSDWPPKSSAPVQRIGDHRPAYLDYEGPVSGNRGQVKRVESGTCTLEMDREDSFLLSLSSGQKIRIERTQTD